MATEWLHVGLAAGVIYTAVLGAFAVPRQWTWAAMGVALANFAYVLLHLVAPFRGLLDPDYAGYRAGVLRLAAGPGVTLVTGAIVVAALTSACLALRPRPGPHMAVIALVDGFLLVAIGLPELIGGLAAPEAYRISLGEYLTVPGLAAVAAIGAGLCVPLVLSIVWSARRMRPALSAT